MLISTGDRIQCGEYTLHSQFHRVVNFVQDGRLASVVEESVGGGPLNLVLRGALPPLHSLRIEEGAVCLDGVSHDITKRFQSSFQITNWDPDVFYSNVEILQQVLLERAPAGSLAFLLSTRRQAAFRSGFEQELVRRVCEAVHLIFGGRLIEGVHALSGCGGGLTPAGDDFIAGLLTARHMRRELLAEPTDPDVPRIREAARSDNLIADSLIECAAEGALCEAHLRLVEALVRAGNQEVTRCADRVMQAGATSGADWLTGLCMTLMEDFDITKERGE